MKKLFILFAILTTVASMAQSVGINADGSTANTSAILDVKSTTKGLLPPRMTFAEKTAISTPAAGLMVYCTNCGTTGEMQYYNGVAWVNFSGGAGATPITVPDAPTSPVATVGNAQASIAFTAPGANGGSAITGYTVTSNPGSFTATGASSPLVVTGLTNGTAYTFTVVATNAAGNSVASAASAAATPRTVPGAPTSPVATVGYKQASIAFTAPGTNGGSTITGYTVTSTPGGFTATGASSPLVVTGLTNGTAYTFTVVATNAAGNSVASAASAAVTPNCGAFVSPGTFKIFACYNLGATDTSVDPNVPVQAIHGNYYQWGRSTIVANASTSSAEISGWNITNAPNGAWADGSKTANDPCPSGFRVPTKTQWEGVAANNTVSKTGTFTDSATNFGTAVHVGPNASTKSLTLPATGFRSSNNGVLFYRGNVGYYCSSTEMTSNAWVLLVDYNSFITQYLNRTVGMSVRCVSE